MVTVALLSSVLLMAASVRADGYCYADDPNPYLGFATKTAYELTHYKKGIAPVPGCTPVQLWLVSRHGTRWPDADEFGDFKSLYQIRDHIISNYNANKGDLCLKDIENLKTWEFNASPENSDMLTEQGKQDLYFLGKRIRSYFPELINTTTYSPDKFVFRHTDTPRTKESAEYFARGVLDLNLGDPAPSLPPAIHDDRLIYPYDNCPAWSDNSTTAGKKERSKFYSSLYMQETITRVSKRLGFDYNLTLENIRNIHDGCRYQKAWDVAATSPWCAAFSRQDLEVLEYSEDLKYYYKSGPGTEMNLRLACPLTKDLFDHFSEVENNPNAQYPRGLFYFSHATMVDLLTARLGLYEDSMPLTADNFPEQQRREFRTSHIIPFTGNVLAVLYKCSDGLQTIFYQAEDIVRYPGCSVGLCNWSYIKQKFASFVQDPACTNDKFCFEKSSASTHLVYILALLASPVLCLL